MMLEKITIEFIFQFMLVFARLGTAFSKLPAIGSPYIFMRGKLAFALTVSFVMMPILQPYLPRYSENFANNDRDNLTSGGGSHAATNSFNNHTHSIPTQADHTHSVTLSYSAGGGNETRPENIAVYYLVRGR